MIRSRRAARAYAAAAALAVFAAVPVANALGGGPAPPARARTVAARPLTPIKHVVVIYMENHSFDNVLGYWCDGNPGRCPKGGMPSSVILSDGAFVTPAVGPDTVPNVNHSVAAQVAAMNCRHGTCAMNGWQNIAAIGQQNDSCSAATGYRCISGYLPRQIPNLTTLARDFAISDDTFSMADSPSWGGHLYAAMASLDGFTGDNPVVPKGGTAGPGWGCDSGKVTTWQANLHSGKEMIPSCIPDFNLGRAHGGAFEPTPAAPHSTIFDELNSAGLSWKIYGDASATHASAGYVWSVCPSIAQCLYTSQKNNLVDASQFITDAKAGTLPAFSDVVAGGLHGVALDSCHNKFSMTACDNYIGSLVSAVENGHDWKSTAIFITFDDFGGFYDQVPPPGLNPDGTQEGPRVPVIIVSPFARPGFTDGTATTFAGILAYTEQNFGLSALGPNDAVAYPFTKAFKYSQKPLKPVKMATRPLPPSAKRIIKHPPQSALHDVS